MSTAGPACASANSAPRRLRPRPPQVLPLLRVRSTQPQVHTITGPAPPRELAPPRLLQVPPPPEIAARSRGPAPDASFFTRGYRLRPSVLRIPLSARIRDSTGPALRYSHVTGTGEKERGRCAWRLVTTPTATPITSKAQNPVYALPLGAAGISTLIRNYHSRPTLSGACLRKQWAERLQDEFGMGGWLFSGRRSLAALRLRI